MSLSHRDYTVACICPMGVELAPVKALLDQIHPSLPTQRDQNSYILGVIGGHNIVIAVLPEIGTNSAATVATQLLNDFPSIRFGLLVGIGGGVPDLANEIDIRLGDIVVSKPTKAAGGVVQYDMGKETIDGFERTGTLNKPPAVLRAAVQQLVAQHELEDSHVPLYMSKMLEKFSKMKEKYTHPGVEHDQLFATAYEHQYGKTCASCDSSQVVRRPPRSSSSPFIHYGTIGSANRVVKDAAQREKLKAGDLDIMCVEMEAAGLMDSFPCLVIRGICDYADSHKNKKWQPYAAATAAAYMKEILSVIPAQEVTKIPDATSMMQIPRPMLCLSGPSADLHLEDDKGLNLFDAPDMGEGLFIGREAEFQDMESILQPPSDSLDSTRKVLILGGMGGIGKTQLAITYAKRHRHSYSSIFWLNANTEATLNNSLRAVANRILPPETVSKLEDDQVWVHVSSWLSQLDNTRWLLIFDNHDNPDQYEITKYYPSVAHGSIIITTRQPDRVNGEKIKVQSMAKEEESLRILATRSGRDNVISDSDARALAERLDGHPLALATAGAFLSQSSLSFTKYLQRYEATWKVIDSAKELSDYPSRTLYTTWDLSFMQIKQQNIRAANLLRFLAYLDHQDIWYEFLHGGQGGDQPPWFTELVSDEFMFEDAMQTLTRYCLVESHHQTGSYSLHVCVHDWTLTGLNAQIDTTQYWLAFNCLASYIGPDDWENLSALRYRRFVPHAVRLVHERFQKVGSQQEWLQNKLIETRIIARLLNEQVQYKAAERMYVRALAGSEKALGPDHTSTLDTVHGLGRLYYNQGKLAEAEQMYLRALAGNEKALGPDHTSTLDTVHGLGTLYGGQGKLAEAEQMCQRALVGNEKALGPDHTSTLLAVHNLGVLYREQGKLAEAEQMCQRALAGYEKALGPDHTSTLLTVYGLGILYGGQGKLAEAEQMYQRALSGYEKALGPDHTSTLNTVHGLGTLYGGQGKLAEAEQMCQRALVGNEKALGPDHTSTLLAVHNLGVLYRGQGKLAEAEQMYVRALAGYEKALGPDHTSILLTVNNLGGLYGGQGKLAEAEQMYQRALAGYEKALGPDHTSTLDTVHNLGVLYWSQGKLAEAEQMYQRALAGREKALGPDHTSTLDTVNNLGVLYRDQGRLAEAEQMYVRALAKYEKALGPDHTSTLNTVNSLGLLYSDQDKPAEAEQMYVRALVGREKALGPDHMSTLNTVHNLGSLYSDQDKLAEAEQMYLRALAGYEKALGPDHTSTLSTVNSLGNLYSDQGKLAEAEQMYVRALVGKEKALGPDHTSTLDTVHNLGVLYWSQGKLAEAEQMYERALAGRERALGPDHTLTLDTVNNLGILYWDQGKLAEAEQMYVRTLVGRERVLGPDHMSTLNTVHNIGNLYSAQGKLTEAEQMYVRALAGYEKALGPDHTSTLDTVNNLGNLYSDQGKLAEAEQMYERALAGYEKALGPDHTSTLDTVHSLGALYHNQDKLAVAEQMYERALAGYEKVSLSHTIAALNAVRNLGVLYRDQAKMEQAKKMFQRAVLGREKVLGPHHPRTLEVVNYLRELDVEVTEKTSTSATIHQGKGIAGKIYCD